MADFLADLRYALRNLHRAPALFSLVIAILAAGIGISVSIFCLVDGVLLRPLPYREPDRILALTTYAPRPPFESNGSLSYRDFQQIKNKSRSFSDVAITYRTGWSRITLTGGAELVTVQGAFVSPNLFQLFGRRPILGRTFTEEENRHAERLVVISHALWSSRFAGLPGAIGQNLEIGHVRWQIIRIFPPDFQVPFLATQAWLPVLSHPEWIDPEQANPQQLPRWDLLARLKAGVSHLAAQQELDTIWNALRAAAPDLHKNDIHPVSLREHFTGNVRTPLIMLFCSVALLLCIASANVGNLLLARTTPREQEIVIRASLGANRARLLRQFITEALVFSLIGGAFGTFAAIQAVPLLKSFAPANTPLLESVQLDTRGIVFSFALSLAMGFLLGMLPVLRLMSSVGVSPLGAAGRTVTETRKRRRSKDILVVAEFALAMVLLTAAGLLIRSFVAASSVDLGFRPDNLLTVQMDLPAGLQAGRSIQFYREVMQRIAALPGVNAVGGAGNLFYLDEHRNHALRLVEGHLSEPSDSWKPLVWTQVAGDYFRAMQISLIRGRLFDADDGPDSPPVVIVNQTLARRYWPGQDPVGKRVKGFDARGQHDDWLTVVGVVNDTRSGGLERAPFSQIYELQSQRTIEHLNHLVVRTAGDPQALAASIRALIHSVNRETTISSIVPMEMLLDQQLAGRRFQTRLIAMFSAGALLLAALGVFALMHYAVAARTNEIGIRMAIGASAADIARLVLGNSLQLAATGVALGLFGALWSAKLIAGSLFAVNWYDPLSFFAAATLLLVVATLGAYLPSHRASRIDPLAALRDE